MRLRTIGLVVILALGVLLAPLAADAQQAGKVHRIGMLWTHPPESPLLQALLDEFRHGLREHGYTDGQNIALEHRYARGKMDLFPKLATELVRSRVDVIVAPNSTAALTAKQATPTIPIVFATAAVTSNRNSPRQVPSPTSWISGGQYADPLSTSRTSARNHRVTSQPE